MQHHKLRSTLSDEQKRLNELNREQGALRWLTTIPVSEGNYDLTKQLLWDLIRTRFDWTLTILPSNCECSNKFDIRHVFSCKKWGFVTLQHNHSRNITSIFLKEVCKDVRVKRQLQKLMGEYLQH